MIKYQPVKGGENDYMEIVCRCGAVHRVGVGNRNWGKKVDEKGKP